MSESKEESQFITLLTDFANQIAKLLKQLGQDKDRSTKTKQRKNGNISGGGDTAAAAAGDQAAAITDESLAGNGKGTSKGAAAAVVGDHAATTSADKAAGNSGRDSGSDDEICADPDPSAIGEDRPARRRRLDAVAQGGVQGVDWVHHHEQIQGQRLIQNLRRQPGGHPMDRQMWVRGKDAGGATGSADLVAEETKRVPEKRRKELGFGLV